MNFTKERFLCPAMDSTEQTSELLVLIIRENIT